MLFLISGAGVVNIPEMNRQIGPQKFQMRTHIGARRRVGIRPPIAGSPVTGQSDLHIVRYLDRCRRGAEGMLAEGQMLDPLGARFQPSRIELLILARTPYLTASVDINHDAGVEGIYNPVLIVRDGAEGEYK